MAAAEGGGLGAVPAERPDKGESATAFVGAR